MPHTHYLGEIGFHYFFLFIVLPFNYVDVSWGVGDIVYFFIYGW